MPLFAQEPPPHGLRGSMEGWRPAPTTPPWSCSSLSYRRTSWTAAAGPPRRNPPGDHQLVEKTYQRRRDKTDSDDSHSSSSRPPTSRPCGAGSARPCGAPAAGGGVGAARPWRVGRATYLSDAVGVGVQIASGAGEDGAAIANDQMTWRRLPAVQPRCSRWSPTTRPGEIHIPQVWFPAVRPPENRPPVDRRTGLPGGGRAATVMRMTTPRCAPTAVARSPRLLHVARGVCDDTTSTGSNARSGNPSGPLEHHVPRRSS